MDTKKDNRPGGFTLQDEVPAGLTLLEKTPEGLINKIIYVTVIAIGFAITAGAFCEFILKPLWHSLLGGKI